jgi:hypothetical protein
MSNRRDDVFTVLKVIRRGVDETHDLAVRAIQGAAADRRLADQLRDAATGGEWGKRFPEPPRFPTPLPVLRAMVEMIIGAGAGFHTLCLRLIDENETLAMELERIRQDLEKVDIAPRTRNLGKAARRSSEPPDAGPENPPIPDPATGDPQ